MDYTKKQQQHKKKRDKRGRQITKLTCIIIGSVANALYSYQHHYYGYTKNFWHIKR